MMNSLNNPPEPALSRIGRPRRGTEIERNEALINAATRVFLREGYGQASIDKVASEAGVSTRTIYERFKNKAELLAAVITRLVDRNLAPVFATAELARLDLRQALRVISEAITGRALDPESAALFRIAVSEAQRFPELVTKIRDSNKQRLNDAVASFFRAQVARGALALADPDRAAALFLQMICAELHECVLFGTPEEIARLDPTAHLEQVIDVFLFGAVPRTR